jgi:hypothetical protein
MTFENKILKKQNIWGKARGALYLRGEEKVNRFKPNEESSPYFKGNTTLHHYKDQLVNAV